MFSRLRLKLYRKCKAKRKKRRYHYEFSSIFNRFSRVLSLHYGGLIDERVAKGWATYDYTLAYTRNSTPFYDLRKNWSNLKHLSAFLIGAATNDSFNMFFGSLTNKYYEMLEVASLRCHASFYGASQDWIYGCYSRNVENIWGDLVILPDMNANDALFRETFPRLAPITAIRSTDTWEKIDYPLCGRPDAETHILFYTQFIVSTYLKSNK